MLKPRVFIASSSEGLNIAEATFAQLSRDTTPTLWTNQLFVPGRYPLEVLEKEVRRNSFALLVASPDDEVLKRGVASPAMRDNLLFEFGLFAGVLGRQRVFFVCPDRPRVELPSDLFGIVMATYDAERVAGTLDERAAAVQVACQQIRGAISEEWERFQRAEAESIERLRASAESQAIRRLNTVAIGLRDSLISVQRDAFAAFSNLSAFNDVKKRAADEVGRIAASFATDAKVIGVEGELEQLRAVTNGALLDLPFPRELSLGKQASRQQAVNVGIRAFNTFMQGGDAIGHVQDAAATEAGGRLSSLGQRYTEWWERNAPGIQNATARMQDALFNRLIALSSSRDAP